MLVLPFLIAAAPIAFLYAFNAGEVTIGDAWLPLLVSLVLAGIVLLIAWLITRNRDRAVIMTSFILVVFFSYGYFVDLMNKVLGVASSRAMDLSWLGLYAVVLVLGILGLRKVTRDETRNRVITKYLAVVFSAFIVMSLVQVGYHELTGHKASSGQATRAGDLSKTAGTKTGAQQPNIYYIILDGYSGEKTLEELHYDNSAFLQRLREEGFYVPSESKSNYTSTYPSLASSLNMRYLQKSDSAPGKVRLRERIEYNDVMKFLRSRGYEIVHFGSAYPATSINRYADVSYSGLSAYRNEFTTVLIRTTMARGIVPSETWFVQKEKAMRAFSEIPVVTEVADKPLFVFAHVLPPHPPYLFDSNGNAVKKVSDPHKAYIDQLIYVNKRVESLIDSIKSESKVPPIIVLQGDHSVLYTNDIFNAYLLPNGGNEALWNSISPVNTFRVIFSRYFGAPYAPLEDKTP
jgi:hypothetical protein